MSTPLQQFFLDLKTFAADLRDLCNGRHLRNALAGGWQDLRQDRLRQLPLIFTVSVHLGALILSLTGPLLLSGRVRIPEVYQVELYNAVEPPPEAAPAPVVQTVAPPPVKVPVKTAPTPAPVSIANPKAVSLSPIKQRLLKEQEERQAQERQARLLNLRLEELKLDRQQKQAEEAAREAASQAVGKIADLYRTTPAITPTATGENQSSTVAMATPAPSEGSGESSPRQLEALERYKARLFQHIKPNWQLPDLQNWDETLVATIVLKMNWDGSVDTTWFEKKSGDSRFDQYVKKAIDNSVPLPPLPLEFDRRSEEIAVTFTPGGLR